MREDHQFLRCHVKENSKTLIRKDTGILVFIAASFRVAKAWRQPVSFNRRLDKGLPIRLSADFSKETLQARRGWQEVFQVMKGKDLRIQDCSIQQSFHLEWTGR